MIYKSALRKLRCASLISETRCALERCALLISKTSCALVRCALLTYGKIPPLHGIIPPLNMLLFGTCANAVEVLNAYVGKATIADKCYVELSDEKREHWASFQSSMLFAQNHSVHALRKQRANKKGLLQV